MTEQTQDNETPATASLPTHQATEDLRDLTITTHRERLPGTRKSITHKFSVSGHKGYITVGLYEDGSPGEIFLTISVCR